MSGFHQSRGLLTLAEIFYAQSLYNLEPYFSLSEKAILGFHKKLVLSQPRKTSLEDKEMHFFESFVK
jgi:hypothetical protein